MGWRLKPEPTMSSLEGSLISEDGVRNLLGTAELMRALGTLGAFPLRYKLMVSFHRALSSSVSIAGVSGSCHPNTPRLVVVPFRECVGKHP